MAAPNDFLSGVIGKVTFVNKWPLLLKATQDDDIPTPGYLFKEIADITYESGSNCQCLVDFLVERLEKKSCHIKYKVLKIMLHVVEQGHPTFCEGLRRKAQGIQASAKYSGPPDPLHGMAPYVAVRKAAKALSEKLFDTEVTPSRPSSSPTWKQGHMTHSTVQSREGTAKKMEGFGNTPVASQKPVTIESLGESVKDGIQQIASKLSGENKSAMICNQADTGYKPLHGYDPTSMHNPSSPVRQGLMSSRSAQWSPQRSIPTNYSPVMMDDGDKDETRKETNSRTLRTSAPLSSSSRQWSHHRVDAEGLSVSEEGTNLIDTSSLSRGQQSNGSKSSDQLSGAGSDLSERLASVSLADWSEEVSTVELFISSHHEDRPTPTKEELQLFVKKSSLLNCEKMMELLTSHLISTNTLQLRCLFGIEGILKEDLISSDVALSLLSSPLTSVQASQDKAVRAKALKILRQLERLEADTSLDQPLMPEGQLISQSVSETAEAEILGPLADTCPVNTALPSDCDVGPVITDEAPKASGGSLFSGMTVATRSPLTPGEKTSSRTSTTSACGAKEVDEGLPVSDLLMDEQLMPSSKSCKADLLFSEAQPSLAASHKAQGESTVRIDSSASHSLCNVNPAIVSLPITKNSVDAEASYQISIDPIMSREAGFADLWKTVSPKKGPSDPESSNQALSQLSTAPPKVDVPSQPHPSMTLQQPIMTSQHISQIYPQLSSAMLSGTTSTPINLSKKPTTGFGFVVDNDDDKQKAGAGRDAFSFVQDAMKSSKS